MDIPSLALAFGKSFLLALAAVLPILNPPASAPIFVNLTRGLDRSTRIALAQRIGRNAALMLGDADLALAARGFLRAGDRFLASERERRDEPRKEHHVAHGQDDERVRGQRGRLGRLDGRGFSGHGIFHAWRRKASTRQPSTNSRATSSYLPGGRSIVRSKRP